MPGCAGGRPWPDAAARGDGAVLEGVESLELRWISRGVPPPELDDRLAGLPARTERRLDLYLVMPALHGLSIKIRVEPRRST